MSQATDLTRGRGLWALGEVLYRRGDFVAAERQLREALGTFDEAPLDSAAAQATLAYIQLAAGRAHDALASAQVAMAGFETLGSFGFCGARVHLVYAQALDAVGQRPRAAEAVEQALTRLHRQADKISDPAFRPRFLRGIAEYEKLVALAIDWNQALPELQLPISPLLGSGGNPAPVDSAPAE